MPNIRKNWNDQEKLNMIEFIKENKLHLKENLYLNIIEDQMKHRKRSLFFQEMGEVVNRTAPKCKSKFQKIEKYIYEVVLEVPPEHFFYFKFLRNKKRALKRKNSSYSKQLKDASEIRLKIIQEVLHSEIDLINKLVIAYPYLTKYFESTISPNSGEIPNHRSLESTTKEHSESVLVKRGFEEVENKDLNHGSIREPSLNSSILNYLKSNTCEEVKSTFYSVLEKDLQIVKLYNNNMSVSCLLEQLSKRFPFQF